MSSKNNYCSHCGEKLDPNAKIKYCPKCGTDIKVGATRKLSSSIAEQLPYKNPGTAALIALVGGIFALPGIGHMYVGKVGIGIGILIMGFILYVLTFTIIISVTSTRAFEAQYTPTGNAPPLAIGVMIVILAIGITYLVLFIWQIFSARKLAKKFNELVKSTGKEPW